MPFKEPSATLLNMFQLIEDRSQRFADSTEQVIADSTNYGPVGTTMALLEASTKFFSGVHKRLHRAQKAEFRQLADLNYKFLEEGKIEYNIDRESFEISKEDYNGVIDVVPSSDPNTSSQAQRMATAQAILAHAVQVPNIHNMKEVTKELYMSLGVDEEKIIKMLPPEEEPQPASPQEDLLLLQQGKPIKAFKGQDHESHIAFKSAFLQDPKGGGNPFMQSVLPLIQANIQEHVLLQYGEMIEGATQGQGSMDEKIAAQAAQKIAQDNARLQELEEQGIDSAKNKVAEAELLRAQAETARVQSNASSKVFEDELNAMKHLLEKEKEENRLIIAALQEETKRAANEAKEQSEMMKTLLEQLNGQQKTTKTLSLPKRDDLT